MNYCAALTDFAREDDALARGLLAERVGVDPMQPTEWKDFCRSYPNLLHPIYKLQRTLQVRMRTLADPHNNATLTDGNRHPRSHYVHNVLKDGWHVVCILVDLLLVAKHSSFDSSR